MWLLRVVVAVVCLIALVRPLAAQETEGPEVVTIGMYVNDIQNIDLTTNSFSIDFFIWHRWRDADYTPATTMEFMNSFESWDGKVTPAFTEPQKMEDGGLYMSTRYQGQFSTPLPLISYPFDRQTLQIIIEDGSASTTELVYAPDKDPVSVNQDVNLSDYKINQPALKIQVRAYPTNFGDNDVGEPETYSRAIFSIPLTRPNLTFGFKTIFPILLVTACAALSLWLHPGHSEARVGLVVTALLTLVALQLTSNAQLPAVNYLIMMDGFYILAYMYVLASLTQVVRSHWLIRNLDEAYAIGQDRKTFVGLSLLLGLGFAAVLWQGLTA